MHVNYALIMDNPTDVDVTTENPGVKSLAFENPIAVTDIFVEDQLPESIFFPEELNTYLRERIRDLTTENGCLRRTLEETEEQLRNFSKKTCPLQQPINLGKSSETAATKIVELSRKCRERAAEVESLKTKCKNLENKLASKEAQLEQEKQSGTNTSEYSETNAETCHPSPNDAGERIKVLTEKLQHTQAKLCEARNTCASLKHEINKAQKLLSSEIGENVTIASLSSQPGGWRGRAEQISLLQQRVTELQTKLAEYEGTAKGSSVSLEKRNLANIRNAEKERRQQIENSAKELMQTELAFEACKRKLEASKARIKVLENELNSMKNNMTILHERRSQEEHLIDVLNNRVKMIETRCQERENDWKLREERLDRECTTLRNDVHASKMQIDRLRGKLEDREIEIDKLKSGILPEEHAKPQRTMYLYEDRSARTDNLIPNKDPNEYITLALAAEAERERLLELVTVLNRRLDKERHDTDAATEALRNERNRSVKLEGKLRKLESERVGLIKVDTGYRVRSSLRNIKGGGVNDESVHPEQMRYKLELLEEECLALKARLDTVQQDKASDLKMYRQMLDNARKMFDDACRGKSSSIGGSRSTMTL